MPVRLVTVRRMCLLNLRRELSREVSQYDRPQKSWRETSHTQGLLKSLTGAGFAVDREISPSAELVPSQESQDDIFEHKSLHSPSHFKFLRQ